MEVDRVTFSNFPLVDMVTGDKQGYDIPICIIVILQIVNVQNGTPMCYVLVCDSDMLCKMSRCTRFFKNKQYKLFLSLGVA